MGAARVDELIREATYALQAVVGPTRTIYLVGEARFAFLSPPDVETQAYVEQLRAALVSLRSSTSVRFVTNVAVGVRPFQLGGVSADDLLRGAITAAQDARNGNSAVALYSSLSDAAQRRQYSLLRDFGSALEAVDQLRLVYQPRIELKTGRCVGVEALLRWKHPQLGEISPGEFIPVIEPSSLAKPMTQWVLDAAMDQVAKWEAAGRSLPVSVNVSAANLSETDLVERVQLGLLRRSLRPELLELEVTESAIMEHPDQALAMLQELAAAGVSLAIDDFGTGHSSLAYLQRLPAQVLKIDQAFVRNLTQSSGSDFILVEMMVGLAKKLGFRVVAEGVETADAVSVLQGLGCEEVQGFFFARPMEAAVLGSWIADQASSSAALRAV
jgi:EAL domain-containing protein (putative c-di-GMP-specific phosphodiesterase class I)